MNAALQIARGDAFLDENEGVLRSELAGVADTDWTTFVRGMVTATVDAVSPSNALGMFEMTPRRMADLGIVGKLQRSKKGTRTIWVAVFVPPNSCDKFLKSPGAQYKVFTASVRDYARMILDGELEKNPSMSMSGALAILHRAGPSGLKSWAEGKRFGNTVKLYDKVAGVFDV